MINIEEKTGNKNIIQEHVRGTSNLQEGWDSSNSEETSNKHIRFIDLFGGIGGFRLGFERAGKANREKKNEIVDKNIRQNSSNFGYSVDSNEKTDDRFKCVGYYDIDRYATQVYNKQFGESHKPTDITKISSDDIPEHDLLCAGVPCQAWSIAGKRKGFEDSRGTMWFEVFRIAKEKQPAYLLLENVKGILSHNEGRSFEMICESLTEIGYAVDFTIFNSKNWGVPQNRERVFIHAKRLDLIDECQLI